VHISKKSKLCKKASNKTLLIFSKGIGLKDSNISDEAGGKVVLQKLINNFANTRRKKEKKVIYLLMLVVK